MPDFLTKIVHNLVSRHFFIALCAVCMVWATLLLNNLVVGYSPYTFFLFGATFLIYNFHSDSFLLDYSSVKAWMNSVQLLNRSSFDIILYLLGICITLVFFFELSIRLKILLIPVSVFTLLYSLPFWGFRKRKLREILFVKLPLISLIWSFVTVILPMVEQNIMLESTFVFEQLICRFLFIFGLCVPFEIRDVEIDRSENIKTIPVVYGTKLTKGIGITLLLLEMLIHHWMDTSLAVKSALDISTLFAMCWILLQKQQMSNYYFKYLVDGTMILRFIFLYTAIRLL